MLFNLIPSKQCKVVEWAVLAPGPVPSDPFHVSVCPSPATVCFVATALTLPLPPSEDSALGCWSLLDHRESGPAWESASPPLPAACSQELTSEGVKHPASLSPDKHRPSLRCYLHPKVPQRIRPRLGLLKSHPHNPFPSLPCSPPPPSGFSLLKHMTPNPCPRACFWEN